MAKRYRQHNCSRRCRGSAIVMAGAAVASSAVVVAADSATDSLASPPPSAEAWYEGGTLFASDSSCGGLDPAVKKGFIDWSHVRVRLHEALRLELDAASAPASAAPAARDAASEAWGAITVSATSSRLVHDVDADGDLNSSTCIPGVLAIRLAAALARFRARRSRPAPRTPGYLDWLQIANRVHWMLCIGIKGTLDSGWGVAFALLAVVGEDVPALAAAAARDLAAGGAAAPTSPTPPERRVPRPREDSSELRTAFPHLVFVQFKELTGLDYELCAWTFTGQLEVEAAEGAASAAGGAGAETRRLPAAYAPCRSGADGAAWPHHRLAEIALRQPWRCGIDCVVAAAFANFALADRTRQLAQLAAAEVKTDATARTLLKASKDDSERWVEEGVRALLFEFDWRHWDAEVVAATRRFPLWSLLFRMSVASRAGDGLPISGALAWRLGFAAESLAGSSSASGSSSVGERSARSARAGTVGVGGSLLGSKRPQRLCWEAMVNGKMHQQLAPREAVQLYQAAATVGRLLDRFGVQWWLSHGALLGAMRHGGLIPTCCDIDLDVMAESVPTVLSVRFRDALANAGYMLSYMPNFKVIRICSFSSEWIGYAAGVPQGIVCDDLMKVELFIMGKTYGGMVHYLSLDSFERLGLFRGLVRKGNATVRRQRARLGPMPAWVPRPAVARAYLNIMYGRDWNQTIKGRCRPRAHTMEQCSSENVVHLSPGVSFRDLQLRPQSLELADELAKVPFRGGQQALKREVAARRPGRVDFRPLWWSRWGHEVWNACPSWTHCSDDP
eukprot:TRINITY_DN24741_c0_g1_i1.p1 TRINITY_DN24741_c0_g1~~TRINITY_DN24741_c0_g1_i1.p1  ORF type:complete len:789 (+),score=176.43 TRINITY_DN24741_c0_g1_i1:78-2444(+)